MNLPVTHMQLSQLLDGFVESDARVRVTDALEVQGVSLDSRLVQSGDLYLAMAGATAHGLEFVEAALEKGAAAVVIDESGLQSFEQVVARLQANGVSVSYVPQLKRHAGAIAARFYQHPSKHMKVVAVTGTDGKTSVCRFIASALNATEQSCGYIGTLGWGLSSLVETQLTTPDSVSLQRMLAELRAAGANVVALEASSHGLEEGRLDAVQIDVAVLTNFGRDHLDYHKNLDAYKQAKARLFNWPDLQFVVLNGQDELGQEILRTAKVASVVFLPNLPAKSPSNSAEVSPELASSKAQVLVSAESIELHSNGLQFALIDNDQRFELRSHLMGAFNVENLLACHGALRALGHAANDASNALVNVEQVPGRIEQFSCAQKPTAIVDYAHTPQALAAVIGAVRHHCEGTLWVVFGCGGDRDPGKRGPMGVAAEQADRVIVTDDNPRTERSEDILEQIVAGMNKPEQAMVIANRGEAIKYALAHAANNDLVLIAGKGHEDYQIVGTKKHAFSDRDTVQQFMQEAV